MDNQSANKDNHLLERLYIDHIQLNPDEDKKCKTVIKKVLDVLIKTAKEKSSHFKELYRETYFGGSYYDGLKVKSTDFEFDLNIVFQTPKTSFTIINLGDDTRMPNFANMQCHPRQPSEAWKNLIIKDRQGNTAISPKSMFKILHNAVDRALTEMNTQVVVNNETFKVTRSTGGAPVVINVCGPGVKFTVDLVPAFKLELSHLKIACPHVFKRVETISKGFNIESREFMAIALNKASSDMFEIDFHDVERGLLKNAGGCVYKVVKLLKYLRDQTGGTVNKLWSHLLKTRVMHWIIEKKKSPNYWNNNNLQTCFTDSLIWLMIGLQKDSITDLFFPEYNMLDKIPDSEIKKQICKWLDRIVKTYIREYDLSIIFPQLANSNEVTLSQSFNCSVCNVSMSGEMDFQAHMAGKQHKAKYASSIIVNTASSGDSNRSSLNTNTAMPTPRKEDVSNVKTLGCELCDIWGLSEVDLKTHNAGKTHMTKLSKLTPVIPPTVFKCNVCDIIVNSAENLKAHKEGKSHLTKMKNVNLNPLNVSNKNSSTNSTSVETKKFQCELCNLKDLAEVDYKAHIEGKGHYNMLSRSTSVTTATASNTVYECDICGISATSEENLKAHKAGKPHQSKMKSAGVVSLISTKIPVLPLTNTNQPILSCSVCQVSFNGKEPLNEHLKSKKHIQKISREP